MKKGCRAYPAEELERIVRETPGITVRMLDAAVWGEAGKHNWGAVCRREYLRGCAGQALFLRVEKTAGHLAESTHVCTF